MPLKDKSAVLTASGLKKSFGSVLALSDGSITLRRGEITALVGDNGAGKSTLIKCLSGVISPDGGRISVMSGGAERTFERMSISGARSLGIASVYQDLALVDTLDVASNIWLGSEPSKFGVFIDRRRMVSEAEELLKRLSVNLAPEGVPVGSLSGGQRQAAAVVRAIASLKMSGTLRVFQGRTSSFQFKLPFENQTAGHETDAVREGGILILDEPSAAMGVRESEHLLSIMRGLRDEGTAILWISHNLPQILKAADRVTVMRGGRTVREAETAGLDPLTLAGWMAGAI